ncbi:hypothetical protein ASF87_08095 [Microbacterium sp. Leaf161]|uniref:hypothetical protein n=1 Tax=Microbacterium sp. Leaf161 TaxID=1736281 RepID=UPI0006F24039|nr:hypothetical protein [Microbacterium sp. Leaf161]KQR48785.1 hypothetical protein ASF87_08095 [Microbacterium sp. Leaf161]
MRRSRAAAVLLVAGILLLTACGPDDQPVSSESAPATVAPLDDPQAPAVERSLGEFREEVPELSDLPLEQIEGLTIQQNDRLWILGSSEGSDPGAALHDAIVGEFGEFPESDQTTVDGGTVYQTTVVPDGRAIELTLNDLRGEAFLLSVLLED